MKLVQMNWNPGDRQLRQFGVACLIGLPLVAHLFGANTTIVGLLLAIGGAVAVTSAFLPKAVKPLFIGISLATTPLGVVVGEIVLLAIFFGLFLPIGLTFRILGRDALARRLDRSSLSYWQAKRQPRSVKSYYHQF